MSQSLEIQRYQYEKLLDAVDSIKDMNMYEFLKTAKIYLQQYPHPRYGHVNAFVVHVTADNFRKFEKKHQKLKLVLQCELYNIIRKPIAKIDIIPLEGKINAAPVYAPK